MGAAGEVYRRTPNAAKAGIGAGVLVLVGLVVYLLWGILKNAGDAVKHVTKTASNIAEGLENLTEGGKDLAAGAGAVIGGAGKPNTPGPQPDADEQDPELPALQIRQVGETRHAPGWDFVRTRRQADFEVIRRDTGARVAANLFATPTFGMTKAIVGTQELYYDGYGTIEVTVEAPDISVITGEAEFDIYAQKQGFRDSNVIHVF